MKARSRVECIMPTSVSLIAKHQLRPSLGTFLPGVKNPHLQETYAVLGKPRCEAHSPSPIRGTEKATQRAGSACGLPKGRPSLSWLSGNVGRIGDRKEAIPGREEQVGRGRTHSCRPRQILDAGEWSDWQEKGMDLEPEIGGYSEKGGR